MQVMASEKPREVASLNARKAIRFLQHLSDAPFVALVFQDDGSLRVYVKDITEDQMRIIDSVLQQINEE